MKKIFLSAIFAVCFGTVSHAPINIDKAINVASKGAKSLAFYNEDAAKLSKEAVDWMDKNNKVADAKSAYTKRLNRLFAKHKTQDGLKLNYKVYLVSNINAFACADGSIRVFSSLMDIMTDDELLAIIGHEIGHVKNEDTKDAIKTAYLKAAALDAASAASGTVQKLNDSQLGEFANVFLYSSHSQAGNTGRYLCV